MIVYSEMNFSLDIILSLVGLQQSPVFPIEPYEKPS